MVECRRGIDQPLKPISRVGSDTTEVGGSIPSPSIKIRIVSAKGIGHDGGLSLWSARGRNRHGRRQIAAWVARISYEGGWRPFLANDGDYQPLPSAHAAFQLQGDGVSGAMAKQVWARLSSYVLKQGGNTRFMQQRFNNLFMRHHKNADEILVDRKGVPLAAVYFTPDGKHPDWMRSFMKELRDRTSMEERP